jgi:hypothetical protein
MTLTRSRKQDGVISMVVLACAIGASSPVTAGESTVPVSDGWPVLDTGLALQDADQGEVTATQPAVAEEGEGRAGSLGFREVNRFFNVREANPDVGKDEFMFEWRTFWGTRSDGSDDDVAMLLSLTYGVTDDFGVELDVMPMNVGDGGDQGNGDLAVAVLYRFVREQDRIPAIAGWADMRIPSGDGSSRVDASFNVSATKSLTSKIRVNVGGGVETLNGARGDDGGFERSGEFARERLRARLRPFDLPLPLEVAELTRSVRHLLGEGEPGRRSFRWNVGVGVDYAFTEDTIGVLNYFHRSSEEEGLRNQHLLEVGCSHHLGNRHVIKFALDVGLTGAADTPNLVGKFQYGVSF